jgi:hypothetical protein
MPSIIYFPPPVSLLSLRSRFIFSMPQYGIDLLFSIWRFTWRQLPCLLGSVHVCLPAVMRTANKFSFSFSFFYVNPLAVSFSHMFNCVLILIRSYFVPLFEFKCFFVLQFLFKRILFSNFYSNLFCSLIFIQMNFVL